MKQTFALEVDGYLKDMTGHELKQIFGYPDNKVSKACLIRTVILNEKQYSTITYKRTLRRFWYFTFKPILEKLGELEDLGESDLENWNVYLSDYFTKLFRQGYLTYDGMNILDISRDRDISQDNYSTTSLETYGFKTGIGAYPNIIFCTEKDSGYADIRSIAEFFGFSSISGSGQCALAATEDFIRNIYKTCGRDIYYLSFTDYDPFGYSIADTFANQAIDVVNNLDLDIEIYADRIGMRPDQLTDEEIENNKYTPKAVGLDNWFRETGGINGEKKGIELDALTPQRVREIFVDAIEEGDYIDTSIYMDFIKSSFIKEKILTALEPMVISISGDIMEEIKDEVDVSDFDLFETAKQGYSRIPLSEVCSIDETGIDKMVNDKLRKRIRHLIIPKKKGGDK